MLTTEEIKQIAVPIFEKYQFLGDVRLLDTKHEPKNTIRFAFDIDELEGGALRGIHLSDELKNAFEQHNVKIGITSTRGVLQPMRALTHTELRDRVINGLKIYGN